jgi:hypothetical protein
MYAVRTPRRAYCSQGQKPPPPGCGVAPCSRHQDASAPPRRGPPILERPLQQFIAVLPQRVSLPGAVNHLGAPPPSNKAEGRPNPLKRKVSFAPGTPQGAYSPTGRLAPPFARAPIGLFGALSQLLMNCSCAYCSPESSQNLHDSGQSGVVLPPTFPTHSPKGQASAPRPPFLLRLRAAPCHAPSGAGHGANRHRPGTARSAPPCRS